MATIKQVFHSDHGVSDSLLNWALDSIAPKGFFLETLEIPEEYEDLQNNLYGPACGDAPVGYARWVVRDPSDPYRPETRVTPQPPRPTRLLTVCGMATDDGILVFTAYGGPAADRVPNDPSLAEDPAAHAASVKFWVDDKHALSTACLVL